MILLGLTGSIGMGKTTTAAIFREFGVPVFDADRCVHDLYQGPAVDRVESIFPGVKINGTIDRIVLGKRVFGDEHAIMRLESIIHPMIDQKKKNLLVSNNQADHG
jgi:dephospho-CoA kinase